MQVKNQKLALGKKKKQGFGGRYWAHFKALCLARFRQQATIMLTQDFPPAQSALCEVKKVIQRRDYKILSTLISSKSLTTNVTLREGDCH